MYQEIKYYIDGKETKICLINGQSVTEEEVEALREKYFKKGYEERMVGYYDKWYRYYTFDGGKSYDLGVMEAAKKPNCLDCTIIECLH